MLRRELRAERWQTEDPVWWRSERSRPLESMTPEAVETYERSFKAVAPAVV
ncbi:hypothetical protein GS491_24000 [Rhodococcus hoagii]|nr:hypothetical protein [Prescottella equi]